jgi:hypothetical protein
LVCHAAVGLRALPANLCLFCECVEGTEFGEDFSEPVGKAIQRMAYRVVGQSPAEHFQDVLCSEYGIDHSVEAEANGSSRRLWLWHEMSRM